MDTTNSTTPTFRSRIVGHRRINASALKAHPLNPRTHPDEQRAVLRQLVAEVGLARSVLAYVSDEDRTAALARKGTVFGDDDIPLGDDDLLELAPLTLIDGHLRQEEFAGAEVDVEILDVNDDEARTLLLSIDPIAQLASYNCGVLAALQEASASAGVQALWANVEKSAERVSKTLAQKRKKAEQDSAPEKYEILITCSDEHAQVKLLRSLKKAGIECKALIS